MPCIWILCMAPGISWGCRGCFFHWLWTTLVFELPQVLKCSASLLDPLLFTMVFLSVHHSVTLLRIWVFSFADTMLKWYCISGPFTLTRKIIGWKPALVGIVTACVHLMIVMILSMLLTIKVERMMLIIALLINLICDWAWENRPCRHNNWNPIYS